MWVRILYSLFVLVGLYVIGVFDAQASDPRCTAENLISETDPDMERRLQEAKKLVEEGSPEQVIVMLTSREDKRGQSASPYISARHGSKAFWLITAKQQVGKPSEADRVMRNYVLHSGPCVDVRVADQLLWSDREGMLSPQQQVAAYHTITNRVRDDLFEWERGVVEKYMAQVIPLLSESERSRVILNSEDRAKDWQFSKNASEYLLGWWEKKDLLLSTEYNERTAEHIGRVRKATTNYQSRNDPRGFDDRGAVYVQYGAPQRKSEIRFDDTQFIQEIIQLGSRVSHGSFPRNEIWSYPHLGTYGRFLFIQRGDGYEQAEVTDLIPSELQRGFNHSRVGQRKSMIALRALRHIYRRIAMHYGDFGNLYSDIDSFLSYQEAVQALPGAAGVDDSGQTVLQSLTDGPNDIARTPGGGVQWPSNVLRKTIRNSIVEDRNTRRERTKTLPTQYSSVLSANEKLPVIARTARFLNNEGGTRVDIYWQVGVEADSRKRHLIEFTSRTYSETFTLADTEREAFEIEHSSDTEWLTGPHTSALNAPDSVYHIAMQWSQLSLEPNRYHASADQARIKTVRIDSLRSLHTDGRFEMSDLKPLKSDLSGDIDFANQSPLISTTLQSGYPLPIYFELYNLSLNQQDRTTYTVQYEVEYVEERSGVRGFFFGDHSQRTSTELTYEGEDTRTNEYVIIPINEFDRGNDAEIEITVRVTDDVAGHTVERPLLITLRPGS